jgi:hypothetical protein
VAPGARCSRNVCKVIDVVIEDDVDAAGSNIFLNPLAVFVRVSRVEKLRVRVNNCDLLLWECVLDLACIF